VGAIIVAALFIILATFIGLGLTVLAPSVSLSGSSTVAPGGSLTLHGSSFLPNSSVTLILDTNLPLYFSQRSTPGQQSATARTWGATSVELLAASFSSFSRTNTVPVHGDGTFTIAITVNPSWSLGQHTIHASEALTHRSASLSFTVVQSGSTAQPTPTPGATVTITPVATPTLTPTPGSTSAPAPPTLSCATPGNLVLGPVSEFSSQTVSGNVTLCTAGAGTLTWQAQWNQNQAPWLHINQGSGSVQAPNATTVTISASPAKLAAGTYTATITFIGIESNTTQAVNVTLTVKAGCVNVTPRRLSFVGVAGVSDPNGAQTISLTNCGLTGNWSAQVVNGSNWLSINPGRGALKSGATGTITVTASNLQAGLRIGSYQDTISIKLGTQTTTVTVVLTVQAPPTLSASPTSLYGYSQPCGSTNTGAAICTIILVNTSSDVSLTWSASADVRGVTVQPASGYTLAAGASESVTLVFVTCTNTTVTFSGPANSVSVTWGCQPIQ
jgi:hypothetical protein